MGLINALGAGLTAATKTAQPFILNMQEAEIQKLRDERMAELAKGTADYTAERTLKDAPKMERIKREGLIETEKEKAALWGDPDYVKQQALAEKTGRAPRDTSGDALKRLQEKAAELGLTEAQKNAGYKEGLVQAEANLANAKPGTPEYDKASADVSIYSKALQTGSKDRNDPLSSGVSAARAVLADIDSSDTEKAQAREFLANAFGSMNQKLNPGKPSNTATGKIKRPLSEFGK